MMLILFVAAFWSPNWPSVVPQLDLPPLSDIERFPGKKICQGQLAFLSQRRAWLEEKGRVLRRQYPWHEDRLESWFTDAFEDLNARQMAWYLLCCAHTKSDGHYHMHDEDDGYRVLQPDNIKARQDLKRLREIIGERDYNGGIMPALINPYFLWSNP